MMTSPVRQHKRKSSELAEGSRSSIDPLTNEEFIKAEEEMRTDHTAFYQLFLDIPDVHPDYTSHHGRFKEEFAKRIGNDQVQFRKLWEAYWYEFICQKEEEDWDMKIKMLTRQHQVRLFYEEKRNKEKLPRKRHSELKKHYVVISSDDEDSSGDSKNTLVKNLDGDEGHLTLNYSLELLEEVCDSLGDIFGSVLKRVIKKISELSSSTKDVIAFLSNKDTVKLLKWAAGKLKVLSNDAEGSQKNKLLHCSNIALKLIVYGSEGAWKPNQNRLDIDKVAIDTFNKDIPTTLTIIEESLKYIGIDNPSREIMNSIFTQVSARHLKMV